MKQLMRNNILFFSVLFLASFFSAFCQNLTTKPFNIVLDAGHGGKDPGRPTQYGYKEKDIALSIVLKVGKLLSKNKDVNVIYTRKTDVFVDLFKRGKIANNADADLFVSVHCNAHNSNAYGSETYVLGIHRNKTNMEVAKAENEVIYLEDNYEKHYEGFDPNSPESLIGLTLIQEDYLDQSILLADYVQNNFTNQLKRKNRGVKQAGFIVLHQTYMPSILIETGFITNKKEGDYLNSKKGQDQISKSIAQAILKYKSQLEFNIGEQITTDIPEQNTSLNQTVYKIQIAASSRKVKTTAKNFKGLTNITVQKNGDIYRYFYSQTNNFKKAQQLKKEAIDRGFTDAIIKRFDP